MKRIISFFVLVFLFINLFPFIAFSENNEASFIKDMETGLEACI